MASREGTVLLGGSADEVSARDESDGYSYLPWVDLICAGVPCQDVSVAGKRAGLKGERTGLFYDFARILQELRPTWFVFENVPGLLSSNDGRDFAEVQRVLMVECGYGICWRVLDSQFFGVAQVRERLFVVGCFGKPCPAQILFEPAGSIGDFAAGEEARQTAARDVVASLGGSGRSGGFMPNAEQAAGGQLVCLESGQANASIGYDQSPTLTCLHEAPITIACVKPGRMQENQNGRGWKRDDRSYTLSATDEHAVAGFNLGAGASAHTVGYRPERSPTLRGGNGGNKAGVLSPQIDPNRVRDFAGLPEGMDSARYKVLGNAVTASVALWIAERIKQVISEFPTPPCTDEVASGVDGAKEILTVDEKADD